MINSRQQLADYCLRALGAPSIVIEVDVEHIEDAIENAIQFYNEYHFDGITRDYLVYKVTGTVVTVLDATGITVGDSLQSIDGSTKAKVVSIQGTEITINHQFGIQKFALNQEVKTTSSAITTISNIVLGDVDKGYIPAGDDIVGVTKILNVTSVMGSSDYMFNAQYQIMMTEIQALTKAGASTYWQTMNYLGHLDFIMKKEKNFSFNRRMDRLYLEVAQGYDLNANDIVVAEVYKAVNPVLFSEVYNDVWVKKYATALLKRTYGTILKKYTGMQLPGGLTYNGQQTYDEADATIKELEALAISESAPLEMMVG